LSDAQSQRTEDERDDNHPERPQKQIAPNTTRFNEALPVQSLENQPSRDTDDKTGENFHSHIVPHRSLTLRRRWLI
jgi:hypothetical protein